MVCGARGNIWSDISPYTEREADWERVPRYSVHVIFNAHSPGEPSQISLIALNSHYTFLLVLDFLFEEPSQASPVIEKMVPLDILSL